MSICENDLRGYFPKELKAKGKRIKFLSFHNIPSFHPSNLLAGTQAPPLQMGK
jgi:hypothetical protein